MPWQRQFIRRSFAPECVESALSVGRGNGKSSLVAAIAAAAIVPGGPLVDARGETIIIASSLTQARVIFDHVLGDDSKPWVSTYRSGRCGSQTTPPPS